MKQLATLLPELGLTRTEVKVYIDLLEYGPSTAGELTKRTHLHRPNVYDILAKLQEKSLIHSYRKENTKLFVPVNPQYLLKMHQEKEEILKKAITHIESLSKNFEKPTTYIMEGLSGTKDIMTRLLNSDGSPIYMYGSSGNEDMANKLSKQFIQTFHKQRIHNKIPFKCIFFNYPKKRLIELKRMPYTTVKLLPGNHEEHVSNFSIIICDNMVYQTIWSEPVKTIIIESKYVSEDYKKYFDVLWKESVSI